jgi:hypothetical protein
MKKIVRLTEADLTKIVKRVIKEQTEEADFVKAIQRFLNEKLKLNLAVDGKTGSGSKTADAIERYQTMIKVYPVDGVWGAGTWDKMPIPDRKRLKDLVAEEGGLIDKFLHWLNLD